jgi:hypothetical protein
MERLEQPKTAAPNDTSENMMQQALKLYACQDGTVVTRPEDCRPYTGLLPAIDTSNLSKA